MSRIVISKYTNMLLPRRKVLSGTLQLHEINQVGIAAV
jgi:hypothetical protein